MELLFSALTPLVAAGAIVVFWALPEGFSRMIWLCLVSAALVALLHPAFVLLIAGISGLLPYWFNRGTAKRGWLLFTASAALGLIGVKYLPRLLCAFEPRFFPAWVMPLGASYFTFRVIHLIVDNYRRESKGTTALSVATYLFFFPTFLAGPLETYTDFYGRRCGRFQIDRAVQGIKRILLGYFKKMVILGLGFGWAVDPFLSSYLNAKPLALGARPFAFVTLSFLKAYFDLSAYSDLAVGYSALLGFGISENFNFPFLSRNLSEFWRNWHCSLSRWCRDQVYFPIFGMTRKPWLASYASMLVMGLWHNISPNWAAWGLYHGTGLMAVGGFIRWKRKTFKSHADSIYFEGIGIVVTLAFVAMGYAFVATPSLGKAIDVFSAAWASLRSWT